MAGAPQGDDFLRWLYDHAPIARSEIRKQIRAAIGVREVTYRGLQWQCHPRDNSVERALWLRGASDEEEEIDWLIGRLQPGAVFCDIGANCGIYSIIVSAKTGACAIAIEPNPVMRARLVHNMQINGVDNIAVEPSAVGESNGRLMLRMGSRWDYGQASLIGAADKEGVEVDVRPLAEIIAGHGAARADAIKIDVEGFEDRALGPFLRDALETALPASLVIEHLHEHMWKIDLHALAASRGYILTKRTANNLLLTR